MPTINFRLNGKSVNLNVDASMPLLWAIRDVAGITGTKYGCGIAQCGACTVHLNGTAIRSCSVPVSAAAGKEVTTIEGLGADNSHPVQQAWIEHQVPQCGYCQPGMIMTAAAVLKKNPAATDEDLERALQGHICRCGTYPRIREAITTARQKTIQAQAK